jgi:hypothetical protein
MNRSADKTLAADGGTNRRDGNDCPNIGNGAGEPAGNLSSGIGCDWSCIRHDRSKANTDPIQLVLSNDRDANTIGRGCGEGIALRQVAQSEVGATPVGHHRIPSFGNEGGCVRPRHSEHERLTHRRYILGDVTQGGRTIVASTPALNLDARARRWLRSARHSHENILDGRVVRRPFEGIAVLDDHQPLDDQLRLVRT